MTAFISGRLWVVWLALMLATLFSWWTAAARPFETSGAQIGGAIAVAVGFGKVWLIGMHFMDLRESPPLLRRAFDAWTLLAGGSVVALVMV
ncbi:MAG: cytochrome C oxidase subunit IV family protein [Panacagrimonas sp.]